jgi:hypothetical protein
MSVNNITRAPIEEEYFNTTRDGGKKSIEIKSKQIEMPALTDVDEAEKRSGDGFQHQQTYTTISRWYKSYF